MVSSVSDLQYVKLLIMKNIHDIAKKLDEESLSVLEFLLDKIDMDWELSDERHLDNMKIDEKVKETLSNDIDEIKQRCSAYLMLMTIEEN